MSTETKRIQFRQSSHADAVSKNEVLRLGEPFIETDTGELKIGDGVTRYKAKLGILSEAKIREQLVNQIEFPDGQPDLFFVQISAVLFRIQRQSVDDKPLAGSDMGATQQRFHT